MTHQGALYPRFLISYLADNAAVPIATIYLKHVQAMEERLSISQMGSSHGDMRHGAQSSAWASTWERNMVALSKPA